MAVENKYVDTDIVAEKKSASFATEGAKTLTVISTFEVAVADSDASVYRLMKAINPNLIPVRFDI